MRRILPRFPKSSSAAVPAVVLLCCFILALARPQQAGAQCMLAPIPLDARVERTTLIVEGEIVESKGYRPAPDARIHTAYLVKIYKVFKGAPAADYVVMATKGGFLGREALEVIPSLKLRVGDRGVFLANAAPFGSPFAGKAVFEPFGTANGFIRFNRKMTSASEAHYHYEEISRDLYGPLAEYCGRPFENRNAWPEPKKDAKASGERPMVPNIANFAPTTIPAGNFSVLTITGNNFGTYTGQATVRFANADDGGATLFDADPAYIQSWKDTEIRVIVPNTAGSGPFEVVDANGDAGAAPSDITIPYNITSTVLTTGDIAHQALTSDNFVGGFTLHYNNTRAGSGASFFDSPDARAAFERALETWRCATGVNFAISADPTDGDSQSNDTINSVGWDFAGNYETALGVCYNSYVYPGPPCELAPGGVTGIARHFDIVFRHPLDNPNWNPGEGWHFPTTPPPPQLNDFESVCLHEIGHAHQLGHVIPVGGADEVMSFSAAAGAADRDLEPNDITAGNEVMARSTDQTGMVDCLNRPHIAIDPGTCSSELFDPAPVASCRPTATPTEGCFPLTVNFEVETTGGAPTGIGWDFDADTLFRPTAFGETATHTFDLPGVYTVQMITGNASGQCVQNLEITVNTCGTFEFTCADTVYEQNFDDWAPQTPVDNTCGFGNVVGWLDDVTIPTWYVASPDSQQLFFNTQDGNCGSPGPNNVGVDGDGDRSLGLLNLNGDRQYIGARFLNQTGGPISELRISYFGEQWFRSSPAPDLDRLDFQFSTDATSLTTGTWTDFDPLDFETPQFADLGPLNGNLPAYRQQISATIAVNIPAGGDIWIRWSDVPTPALPDEDMLSIDDVRIAVTAGGSGVQITPADSARACNDVDLSVPQQPGQSYQWLRDGAPIPGANNATYTATQSGEYAVETTGGNCAGTSSPVQVTIDAPPTGVLAGGKTVCTATTADTLILNNYSGGEIEWQLSFNGGLSWQTAVTGTDTAYETGTLDRDISFRAVIDGGECPDLETNQVDVVFVQQGNLLPVTEDLICQGETAGPYAVNFDAASVLRWESSTDGGATWNDEGFAGQDTLPETAPLLDDTWYRAVLDDPQCGVFETSPLEVTVLAPGNQSPAGNLLSPGAGCLNGSVPLALLNYIGAIQSWEYSTDNWQTIQTIYTSSDVLNTPPLTADTKFRVVVSGPCEVVRTDEVLVVVRTTPSIDADVEAACGAATGKLTIQTDATPPVNYAILPQAGVRVGNTFSGLPPGRYEVFINDRFGCGNSKVVNIKADAPPAPVVANVGGITETRADLYWLPVPGANIQYRLRWRERGSRVWNYADSLTTTTYALEGLDKGATYEFDVQARCGGDGIPSEWSSVGPDAFSTIYVEQECDFNNPPPTPRNFAVIQTGSFEATVQWDYVKYAAGYVVSYGSPRMNPRVWSQFTVCNPDTFFNIKNLVPGMEYGVRVRTNCDNCTTAVNLANRLSDWSDVLTFRTTPIRAGAELTEAGNFAVYPNPNRGAFEVRFFAASETSAELALTDLAGKTVWEDRFQVAAGEHRKRVILPGVAAGVYLLRLSGGENARYVKLIVE